MKTIFKMQYVLLLQTLTKQQIDQELRLAKKGAESES